MNSPIITEFQKINDRAFGMNITQSRDRQVCDPPKGLIGPHGLIGSKGLIGNVKC